jgi:hypothetical protein
MLLLLGVCCVRRLSEVVSAAGVQPTVLAADTPLTAILAIGSNAGPAQLARKFPLDLFPKGVIVPVSPAAASCLMQQQQQQLERMQAASTAHLLQHC